MKNKTNVEEMAEEMLKDIKENKFPRMEETFNGEKKDPNESLEQFKKDLDCIDDLFL